MRGGGGVAIYIKNNITCKFRCKTEENEKVEYIFVELASFDKKMLVGCAYRPSNRIDFSNFITTLRNLTVPYNDVAILGDLNSNLLLESSFKDSMESLGLTPINTTIPTHYTNTCSTLIDHIYVGDISKVNLYDQISASCFSKHDLMFVAYDFLLHQEDQCYSYRDFKNLNYNLLYENLLHINWSSIYFMTSVDDQLSFLENNILKLYDDTVPLVTKMVTAKNKPWFTNIIRQSIQRRDLAYSRWKRFKTSELKTEFRTARKEVNIQIRNAKSDYYSKRFSSAVESKQTWRTIRDIGIGKVDKITSCSIDADELNRIFTDLPTISTNNTMYNGNTLANNNAFFEESMFEFSCVSQFDVLTSFSLVKSNAIGFDNLHPKFVKILLPSLLPFITHFFNTIIMSSCFPRKWKHAKIIPLPKSKTEYRPIAILCFLSKVLEKILQVQISSYVHEKQLISEKQSGFRPKHSCVTALIDVSENIRREIDVGKVNFLVLLDHSKAFDTVNHDTLCMKIKHFFNFASTSTQLISSYLTDRTQSVCINNTTSNPLSLTRGVPQGSILGPLLFSIYANDLPQQLSYSRIHMYADDVQLYLSSPANSIDENVDKLNHDLNKIYFWATANGLCLNPQKSKCLLIHKKTMNPLVENEILINNQKIQIVKTAKNLGLVFNNNLTWSSHVDNLVIQSYVKLRMLWATQCFTPLRIRMLLAKAYLIPGLIYGCEIFSNCDSTSKNKLDILYNNIIRYVYGLRKYDHVSSFTKSLYGVTFENFLKIRVLIFLHKIIYTRKPQYLYNNIQFARSNRGKKIIIPKHRCLVSEWQFYINAVRLWNTIPHKQQLNSNAMHFKTFLFKFYT